jgi:hypothetical protein
MIHVKHKYCEHDGCQKHACYNYRGERGGRFCVTHKLEGMIDNKNKHCENEGCETRAIYNYIGERGGRFCVTHKLPNMINVRNKNLNIANIKKSDNEKVKLIGSKRSKQDDYPKKRRKSDENGEKSAVNTEISDSSISSLAPPPLSCLVMSSLAPENEHAIINNRLRTSKISRNYCESEKCGKLAHYNFIDQDGARFCGKHKLDGMIKLKNNHCKHEGCEKQACYNYRGEKEGIYCVTHKQEAMINVTSNYCAYQGCGTRACFNYEGLRLGIYCSKHKDDLMVDVRRLKK